MAIFGKTPVVKDKLMVIQELRQSFLKLFQYLCRNVIWKVGFVRIILESIFVVIELKKLLNSFATTLLSVTIESFICKQIGAYLVWVFMFINTFI